MSKELERKIEEIWKAYPNRLGSKGNKKVSIRLMLEAIDIYGFDAVLSSVVNYKIECDQSCKTETEFVKQFASWINCGRGRKRVKGRFLGVEDYREIKQCESVDPKWQRARYFALKKSNGRCCLCGASAKDGVTLHVDHIKPKSLYPELKYELDNLQILCEDCNIGKSNLDDTDWRT